MIELPGTMMWLMPNTVTRARRNELLLFIEVSTRISVKSYPPMRILILLLILSASNLYAADPEIEIVSGSEFVFDLNGSRVKIEIRDVVLRGKKEMLLDWVVDSAKTVENYYGQFPVKTVRINLQVTDGHAVRFGQAFGGKSPYLRIVVGENVNPEMLRKDWILVHEMVHLAMANVPRSNRWLLEGLATYVESIARAQRGRLSEDFVWNGFILRMPQGLPESGDKGLDHTPTWGRTYWGGALFCLLADIEIRKLSDNRLSLQDALRGILKDGYSMHADTNVMQIFESGDRATGIPVLVPLYDKMRADPYPIDLEALWKALGVEMKDQQVKYDDSAPMSNIRRQLFKS
jgi:hypothetical protein